MDVHLNGVADTSRRTRLWNAARLQEGHVPTLDANSSVKPAGSVERGGGGGETA